MQSVKHCLLAFIVSSVFSSSAQAQNYPNKPVRLQTAAAGSTADFVARLLAAELAAPLGQQIIIENKPGGPILISGVAKAAPDGYTLLVSGGNLWTAPLIGSVPYDPIKDFSTIVAASRAPNILVVNPGLPVKTIGDLIALAKAKPGALNYTSGTNGSSGHLSGELFKSMSGTDIARIPYKNQSEENADLLSGRVHMTFGSGVSWASHITAGKMRALATGGAKRSLLFPDLPTVSETLPGFIAEALIGLWAPAKTPEAIVRRLNQESVRALARPEVGEKLLKIGQEPVGGTPEQFAETIQSEIARVGKLVKDVGIRAEGS